MISSEWFEPVSIYNRSVRIQSVFCAGIDIAGNSVFRINNMRERELYTDIARG